MKRVFIACILAATAILGGCATQKFAYDGLQFATEREALAYQSKRLGEGVQGVNPAATKIGGILKIYAPNETAARERYLTGNKQGVIADYLLKAYTADKYKLKEAFERRNSFDAVEVVFSNGLHQVATAGHHTLYLFVESPSVNSWYYIGTKVPRTPVTYDRGTANMSERYKFLIENVESLAMAEKISTKK